MELTIGNGKVVGFTYVLTDNEGKTIDQSGGKTFEYIHGIGNIVIGLENALNGLKIGHKEMVKVTAEEGYGIYKQDLVFEIPKSNFPANLELKAGMEFQADGPEGTMMIIIKEIMDELVLADANHPLAGVDLNFDVEIMSIREATQQELDHGHVHAHGHDH